MQSIGLLFNFLWALALVLGLAWAAVVVLKRMGWGHNSTGHHMEQLDYLPLGPKRGLAIVQVLEHTYCLGITDNQITLLAELDVGPDDMVQRQPVGTPAFSDAFREELMKRLGKWGGRS